MMLDPSLARVTFLKNSVCSVYGNIGKVVHSVMCLLHSAGFRQSTLCSQLIYCIVFISRHFQSQSLRNGSSQLGEIILR
jgi:hypothetical protein